MDITQLRIQAVAVRDALISIEHPMNAARILGMNESAVAASRLARTRHLPAVREALEIIGTSDASDGLPVPGPMTRAGAAQRIGNAARFLSNIV